MVRGITRIWSKTSVQLFLNFISDHLLILSYNISTRAMTGYTVFDRIHPVISCAICLLRNTVWERLVNWNVFTALTTAVFFFANMFSFPTLDDLKIIYGKILVCQAEFYLRGFPWMCLKRRPKNEDRRPKTLSKTKTHWSSNLFSIRERGKDCKRDKLDSYLISVGTRCVKSS